MTLDVKYISLVLFIFSQAILFAQPATPIYSWSSTAGNIDKEESRDNVIDNSGNIISCGLFEGTVDFDPGPGTYDLTANGYNAFIQKLDSDGNFLWARSFDGLASETAENIAINNQNEIIISGVFGGNTDFDPGPGTFFLDPGPQNQTYVVKLDSNGDFMWAISYGGSLQHDCEGVEVDNSNNVVLTGSFKGTVDFDPGSGTYLMSSITLEFDIYVLKLDDSGQFIWSVSTGSPDNDRSYDLCLDELDNIYVGGEFEATCDFDPGISTFNLTSNGSKDAFLFKLDSSGSFLIATSFGGTGWDSIWQVSVIDSLPVVAASISGTVDVNLGVGTNNVTTIGSTDAIVMKLDHQFDDEWSSLIQGPNSESVVSMDIDNLNNIYIVGKFNDSIYIPNTTQPSILQSLGSSDVYIYQFEEDGDFVWGRSFGGAGGDEPNSIKVSVQTGYISGTFRVDCDFDFDIDTDIKFANGNSDVFTTRFQMCTQLNNSLLGPDVLSCDYEHLLTPGNFSVYSWSNGTSADSIIVDSAGVYWVEVEDSQGCINSDTININFGWNTDSISITTCGEYTSPSGIYNLTASGNYTDTLNNIFGCDSVIFIDLTIEPPFISDILLSPNHDTLYATSAGTYQWYNCAMGQNILGENSNFFEVDQVGFYAVIVQNGTCSDTSDCLLIDDLKILETKFIDEVSIYPNPCKESCEITLFKSALDYEIEVYDGLGQIITVDSEFLGNSVKLFTSTLPAGIYFLKIRDKSNQLRYSGRLVVLD